jgi:hypothetical protein
MRARASAAAGLAVGSAVRKGREWRPSAPFTHELADNLAADVSKPEVATLEAVGQPAVLLSASALG